MTCVKILFSLYDDQHEILSPNKFLVTRHNFPPVCRWGAEASFAKSATADRREAGNMQPWAHWCLSSC